MPRCIVATKAGENEPGPALSSPEEWIAWTNEREFRDRKCAVVVSQTWFDARSKAALLLGVVDPGQLQVELVSQWEEKNRKMIIKPEQMTSTPPEGK